MKLRSVSDEQFEEHDGLRRVRKGERTTMGESRKSWLGHSSLEGVLENNAFKDEPYLKPTQVNKLYTTKALSEST